MVLSASYVPRRPNVISDMIDEEVIIVNTATGKYYAVLFTHGKSFNAFGVASMRELPTPLLQWFQDKGGKL